MTLGSPASDRVQRFLDEHPRGPLIICVGSASVAGIAWLAEHARDRPVTLLIGDMKGRNFARATDADRRTARDFVRRGDVLVLNWYRTERSGKGRSEAHLKVWAACDRKGRPKAFLVGSANLTDAGLQENVELMAVADDDEHAYLRSTLRGLIDEAWNAEERLLELVERGEGDHARQRRHRPRDRRQKRQQHNSKAASGCGAQLLAVAAAALCGAAALMANRKRAGL